ILTTLGVIIGRDSEIIIYASLQIILLIFGNILSHLAVMKKQDRRQFDRKTILSILVPLIIGIVIFIPLFQLAKIISIQLWAGFRYLVFILASNIGRILQLFEQDESGST